MVKDSEKDGKVFDVSEVLEKFGRYQIVQYCFACMPAFFVTMININYVFVAGDINYRCRIPECEDPGSTDFHPQWWPNATIGRCSKPILTQDFNGNSTCMSDSFRNVTDCTEWIYETNNTIIAELDLACQPLKSNLVGTIHNVGMLFSMILTGWMSDRFGRKPTVIFCAVASFIGQLKTFAASYYMYVTIEFFESFVSGGIYPATTVMMIEIGGKKNRILAGVIFSYVVYMGETTFACIAMVVPYWKTLIRIVYSPTILFIFYIFLIRESPRWQILNGKSEEAKETIIIAADMNKIIINKDDLKDLNADKLKQKFNIEKYEEREGYRHIFTSREVLKRLLVAAVCRFTAGFVYYGLMINSVLLPGDKYVNFLLSTVMSFPGELIALYFMNKIGRKVPLIFGYLLCGLTCVASAYVPTTWGKIAFFLIGKMVISACYTGIITYTMELFPTSTRGSLLGIGAFMSRSGAMLAPLTPMLTPISPALPTIFFGSSALLSGVLLTLTPETKNLPLMDTIEQVETLAREQRKHKKESKLKEKNKSYETVVTKL